MNHQNYHTLINFFPLKFSHHISQDALPTFDQRLHPGIFLNKRQAVVWCQEVPFVDSWLDIWQFDCQDPITWHQGILEIHSVFCLSSTAVLRYPRSHIYQNSHVLSIFLHKILQTFQIKQQNRTKTTTWMQLFTKRPRRKDAGAGEGEKRRRVQFRTRWQHACVRAM